MKRIVLKLFFYAAVLSLFSACNKQNPVIQSPDGKIKVEFQNQHNLSYSVYFKGQEVLAPSKLGLKFRDHNNLFDSLRITGVTISNVDTTWEQVWGKNKIVRDNFQEIKINLTNQKKNLKMDVIARAYDDGVALRYSLPEQENIQSFELISDETKFAFDSNHTVWATHFEGFKSHQEGIFKEMKLDDEQMTKVTGLPLLVKASDSIWVTITEANLTDWAGMYVQRSADSLFTLKTVLSPYPDDKALLVKSKTPRNSPWRVIMIGNTPGDLIESDIIANLNDPNKIEDTSWIKPGKSSWDPWWSNYYAPDVKFKLGSNNETMKYFIDFAAEMGWQYQLVDWFWYGPPFLATPESRDSPHPTSSITTPNPDIDIPELVKYAADKNVKILVWLEWHHADKQMEEAFPLYEKWGVAGVKVDFMARDDQYAVNFYHRLVKLAAKHHLLADFHGAYKPTGVSRTWPNLITREGVFGNEQTKWSSLLTPEHKVTLPFTRGLLGEMDFTPGAFVNVTAEQFKTESPGHSPMSIGTRCNELAMLVVYESALQVLCDAPYNYRNSPDGLDFLKIVPTTWDQTKVINAEVANYITTARRSGDEWYIGTMTDSDPRTLSIPLSFLGEGKYEATIWKDAPDANVSPTHLVKEVLEVEKNSIIKAELASGGGHVMHIVPKK